MTDTADQHADEWPAVRDRLLTEPAVRGAYEDFGNEARTTLALTAVRQSAGMTRRDVAVWLANHTGMSVRRALRWVRRFEDGDLGSNTPIWLFHTYARAVGAVVVLTVTAPQADKAA